jgi:protein-S-isoprenylcysteine O-methyltransferase Ste14
MWLWARALFYLCLVGSGWLVVLPAGLLYWEAGRLLPGLRRGPVAGLSLFGAGAGLALWAGYYLIRHGQGTPLPLDPPQRLVTAGPYRFVRNPQGIAMTLMATGEAVAADSALLWLLPPLTVLYLEALVGPLEARQLARDFGPEYRAYAARVPKWLPRRPRKAGPGPTVAADRALLGKDATVKGTERRA